MQYEPLSELYQVALMVTALVMPLASVFVRRRESWFDSKLASKLQEIPLNVMLTMIIVVLGPFPPLMLRLLMLVYPTLSVTAEA